MFFVNVGSIIPANIDVFCQEYLDVSCNLFDYKLQLIFSIPKVIFIVVRLGITTNAGHSTVKLDQVIFSPK